MVYDIVERKNAFLGNKNKQFKKSKNWPFFHLCLSGKISQENEFCDILKRKNAFLGCKNKKFKNRKIDIFASFWSKICHFSTFVFSGKISRENVL